MVCAGWARVCDRLRAEVQHTVKAIQDADDARVPSENSDDEDAETTMSSQGSIVPRPLKLLTFRGSIDAPCRTGLAGR